MPLYPLILLLTATPEAMVEAYVKVELTAAAEGKVDCRVLESTAPEVLAVKTCQIFEARTHIQPAGLGGKPFAPKVMTVRYRMPAEKASPPPN